MNEIGQSAGKISPWLGGIIDGEGSVFLTKQYRNNGNLIFQPCVSVSNTDTEIINKTKEEINKVTGCYHNTKKTVTGKTAYTVIVKGMKRNKILLPEIIPLLYGVKKQKAELLLKWIEYRLSQPHNYSATEVDINYYEQMKAI